MPDECVGRLFLEKFGKKVSIYARGRADAPALIVVGPATLFQKGYLPDTLFEHFKVYFADVFLESGGGVDATKYVALTIDDFINVIEETRKYLGLEKISLFGQSSNGIMSLLYSAKYPERVEYNIIVGTTPIRGSIRDCSSHGFFDANRLEGRKKVFEEDQKLLPSEPTAMARYNAQRAYNFYDLESPKSLNPWKDIDLDRYLVQKFFELIKEFDIRSSTGYVSVPTFLALGMYDATCPLVLWTDDCNEYLRANSRLLEYSIFSKSAHFVEIEESDEFMRHLLSFMDEHVRAAARP